MEPEQRKLIETKEEVYKMWSAAQPAGSRVRPSGSSKTLLDDIVDHVVGKYAPAEAR